MDRTIEITPEEAYLIDWLLTMHNYDPGLLELLNAPDKVQLRKKIAVPIVEGHPCSVNFSESDRSWLLITCPITFRFKSDDVGFSLKNKLLALIVPVKINWGQSNEQPSNNNESNPSTDNDTSTNNTGEPTFDGSGTGTTAVQPGENVS